MDKVNIIIHTKQGEIKYVPYVYYVFGLEHNLLSICQQVEKGYNVLFKINAYII